jgi:hypothetical protein
VVQASGCIVESGFDVFHHKIGKFFQYLFGVQAGGEKIQNINDAYPHAANARTPAALFGIDGNSLDWFRHIALLDLRIDPKGSPLL